MNERTKNILKIMEIWFGIILILMTLWGFFVAHGELESIWEIFLVFIICSFGFFIVFFPTILLLYFIFKKIQNKNLRILLTAFSIPFTNLIYLFIEHFCFGSEFNSNLIGFCTLFVTLPIAFLIGLCTPKSILPIKWGIIKTVILTAIFGVGLIILSESVISKIDDITAQSKLEKYEIIIENIENYKKQNGVYPQKIEDNVQKFKQFYYNTKNSDKDYILTVGDSYITQYNYCSSEELEGCYPQKTNYASYEKYGKWIKVVEFD